MRLVTTRRLARSSTIIAGIGAAIAFAEPLLGFIATIVSLIVAAWSFEIAYDQGRQEAAEIATRLERNRPDLSTAAAITGQGQLATWSYPQLVDQLRMDGHLAGETP